MRDRRLQRVEAVAERQRAKVKGLKQEIADAKWLIAEVVRALGDRGFTTSVKLEAPERAA